MPGLEVHVADSAISRTDWQISAGRWMETANTNVDNWSSRRRLTSFTLSNELLKQLTATADIVD
jgi:hypothetical protein